MFSYLSRTSYHDMVDSSRLEDVNRRFCDWSSSLVFPNALVLLPVYQSHLTYEACGNDITDQLGVGISCPYLLRHKLLSPP